MSSWNRLGRGVGALLNAVSAFCVALVGKWEWDPPGWLKFIGQRFVGGPAWARAHKEITIGAVALGIAVGAGVGLALYAHFNQPKPVTPPLPVSMPVSLVPPGLTAVAKDPKPQPLVIRFAGSAAPIERVGKQIRSGVTLTPKIAGRWRWLKDKALQFTPAADWPVGQKVTVTLAQKGLVAELVQLRRYELNFTTAPFVARFGAARFYQDPVDPKMKKVVATVRFTHPVDVTDFEQRIKLYLSRERTRTFKFTVNYNPLRSEAHIHSAAIKIPSRDIYMVLEVRPGVRAKRGGPPTARALTTQVRIPGLYNNMRISSAQALVADSARNEPVQVLVLRTRLGVRQRDLSRRLRACLLPLYHSSQAAKKHKRPWRWSAARLTPQQMKQCDPLKLTPVPNATASSTSHGYRFTAPVGRTAYVRVRKGLKSFGGYILEKTWDAVTVVPQFPRTLRILHKGALLSLRGQRKVSVFARELPGLRFTVKRVLPDQLHHLVTHNRGNFARPSFSYYFNEDSLSEVITRVQPLPKMPPGEGQYAAFDLSRLIKAGARGRQHGLFVVKVEGYDPKTKAKVWGQDRRLILVTDLGFVVKDVRDRSHHVFVQSIASGTPVAGARVQVLGLNGLPVASAVTDYRGHAKLPRLTELRGPKKPTLYLVSRGQDYSFMPIGKSARYLNLSRFNIGGVTLDRSGFKLRAFLFSDRGLYRPGDEIRVGMVVKPADWRRAINGLMLQLLVTDPRGRTVRTHKLRLGRAGFEELRHKTTATSATGSYSFKLYLALDGRPHSLLGSTTVQVREFLPDRMKISARLTDESPGGWVHPDGLGAKVTLKNLFGTPAADRTVRAQLKLSPTFPRLAGFAAYRFHDWMRSSRSYDQRLEDVTTDDKGQAELDLDMSRFASGTYLLRLTAEGFEAEGGRSVVAQRSQVVSSLPYLVGYKPDGALHYVRRASERALRLVAVGPSGKRVAVKGLRAVLLEQRHVSVLTRKHDGTYRYESVRREVPLWTKGLSIGARGRRYPLPTDRPGDFILVLRNDKGKKVLRVGFSVAGSADLTRSLERNTELKLKLQNKQVGPGDELVVQVKAPYTGAGLITVERGGVHAFTWFRARTTASEQRIRLPAGFEGNGYLTVTFIRDINSAEIFSSPLSYGVVQFAVSRAARTAKITLTSAEVSKPGTPLVVGYKSDKKAKIVVFAVDEGILQVAGYKDPDPLGFYFKKRALQVRTAQILDLILPEFKHLASVAGGGDDYDEEEGRKALAANLNPFRRKQDKPVAFWSGILDAGPQQRQVTFKVPDYFNGSLRIVAVAVAPGAVGATSRKAVVRGDFVILPNAPTFVAPGDTFEVSVAVANNIKGSGATAKVALVARPSRHLELLTPARVALQIPALRERSTIYRLRARQRLGPAQLVFTASRGRRSARLTSTMSVRPASPHLTTLTVGTVKNGAAKVPVPRQLYAAFRTQTAAVSPLPLGLCHGLVQYLRTFPHGCTEQLVSQGVPAVVLHGRAEFGLASAKAAETVARVMGQLHSRQNSDGSLGLWAANPRTSDFATIYALHFLQEAADRRLPVPAAMAKRGRAYLRALLSREGSTLPAERLRAYALYVLTRGGVVTGQQAAALHKRLRRDYPNAFSRDLAGAYLAATYKLLRKDKLAWKLIDLARVGIAQKPDYGHYYDGLIRDAQLLYLLAKHFPRRAAQVGASGIKALVKPIRAGSYNTLSSAYTIMALAAYAKTARQRGGALEASELLAGGRVKALPLSPGLFPQAAFTPLARKLRFTNPGGFDAFYTVVQSGFDRRPSLKPLKQKLEVFREYKDQQGKVISRVRLGDEVMATLRVRTLGKQRLANVALVDLLPGGFEVVQRPPPVPDDDDDDDSDSDDDDEDNDDEDDEDDEGDTGDEGDDSGGYVDPISDESSTYKPHYVDVREDRVVLYGSADPEVKEFVYVLKAVAAGTFVVPSIKGASLYDRSVRAQSAASKIEVYREGSAANKEQKTKNKK